MERLEIPPDSYKFRSGGKVYFLCFGAREQVAIRDEFGLGERLGESPDDYKRRCDLLGARLSGQDISDRVAIMHVCLSRWERAAGTTLDRDAAIGVFEKAELPSAPKRCSPGMRITGLWHLFQQSVAGLAADEVEDDPVPKDPALEASTPCAT